MVTCFFRYCERSEIGCFSIFYAYLFYLRKLTCKETMKRFHIRRSFDPSVNSPGAVHQVNRHHIMSINGGCSVTEGEVHLIYRKSGRKGQADQTVNLQGICAVNAGSNFV